MLRITVDSHNPDKDAIAKGGDILQKGGLVAFPTETVYGLGANVLNHSAVAKIYKVKGRPQDNPLIWHANHIKALLPYAEFNDCAYKLAEAFWPGPFTMVLNKVSTKDNKEESQSTVAVRIPSNPVTRALIEASNCIIAAPSANISGRPSPTCADHVAHDFKDTIDMLIDGGNTKYGLESTVVDLRNNITLLRPGAITSEMIESTLGYKINCVTTIDENAPVYSPGMKYKHYAPKAPLILLIGTAQAVSKKIDSYSSQNIGILRTHNITVEDVAKTLFSTLRAFDSKNVSLILAEGVAETGMGMAVMNRLKKAATEVIFL